MFSFFKRLFDTRITCFDVLFLLLKIALTVNLCLFFGPLIGIVLFVVLNSLVDFFITIIYGCTSMNHMDKNVFFDQ